MNSVKNWIRILMAVIIAAIALPGFAAPQYTKQYNLTLTSDPSVPLTVVAHLTNQALGPGNSNVGSFRFTFSGAKIATTPGAVTTNPPVPAANITVSGSSVFVLMPGPPLKAQETIHVTILLQDCGDGITLESDGVQVWTGNMGQTFTPTTATAAAFPLTTSVVCGVLACGDSEAVPDSFNPGSVTVTRGDYDKNGNLAACAGLPYTYTTFDDNTLHFAWPDTNTGNPHAAFELVVFAAGGAIPAPGTTGVAWLNQDGSPVTDDPAFITGNDLGSVTALNCLVPQVLPAPYGTLDAAINNSTDTSITINGVAADVGTGNPIIPATPFPVVIIDSSDATKTERLTATLLTAQVPGPQPPGYLGTYALTYDVTRGTAAEGYPPPLLGKTPHAAGALVMSTPLPILPSTSVPTPYVAETQVQMCIAAQAVVDAFTHSTTFISIGDPWGSQP